MKNETLWNELREITKNAPAQTIIFNSEFAPTYVNEKEDFEDEVDSVTFEWISEELFFKTVSGEIVYQTYPWGDEDGDSMLMTDEDVAMLLEAIKKQERGYAKEIALAVKRHLVALAADDKLPLDINELDEEALTDCISEAINQ